MTPFCVSGAEAQMRCHIFFFIPITPTDCTKALWWYSHKKKKKKRHVWFQTWWRRRHKHRHQVETVNNVRSGKINVPCIVSQLSSRADWLWPVTLWKQYVPHTHTHRQQLLLRSAGANLKTLYIYFFYINLFLSYLYSKRRRLRSYSKHCHLIKFQIIH